MNRGPRNNNQPSIGKAEIRNLNINQILPDPNQPRRKFRKGALLELVSAIKDQGLQQNPTVTFAYTKGGVDYYYIKAGERRWRAHQILVAEEDKSFGRINCVVLPEKYDGTINLTRKIAQAAENSSREPHTVSEIITLLKEITAEEEGAGAKHGSISRAELRLAKAFGKKLHWAQRYRTLCGLIPELVDMLDPREDEEEPDLTFSTALHLARIPADKQKEEMQKAREITEKSGYLAANAYLSRIGREIKKEAGIKLRGRNHDEKRSLARAVKQFRNLAERRMEMKRPSEYLAYIEKLIGTMGAVEVDSLLEDLRIGLSEFSKIEALAKERRETVYSHLRVGGVGKSDGANTPREERAPKKEKTPSEKPAWQRIEERREELALKKDLGED